jgi:aminoglycoside phosphotransferase (APT) family kinase protein
VDHRTVIEYLRINNELRAALGISCDAELDACPIGEGEHNQNYKFTDPESGRAFVLRVNVATQPFHDDQVAYEFHALTALEMSGCTPKPLFLDNSASALGKGVLVISFCEGDELNFDALRPGDLRCAAQLMADIHAVPVPDDCKVFRPSDPLRTLFDECLQRYELYRSSAVEEERITKWVERFIAAAEPLTHTVRRVEDCSHIVNTETLPSHFLIPARAAAEAASASTTGTGRFCTAPGSFIDWERPIIGEVAQDVAYFVSPTTTFWDSNYLFPASEIDTFVEDYWRAVDGRFDRGNFDERFRAFRLMTALRSITWCCRALIHYRGEGNGHTTSKTMHKLPVYLSDEFMEMLATSLDMHLF